MTRLQQLYDELGQSPWLDNLKRSYITSGELAAMRDRGIRGLTSNPTIFQKAIQGSADYDDQFATLAADQHPILQDYWEMVFADIHGACDVLDAVYAASDGVDGYASVEVAPDLAHDVQGTISAARDLHQRLDRRNLMVKIPATAEGVPAIREMISEGRNINVTLIFSLDRYGDVMEAYISGLEAYAADPAADLSRVASVGSFFVSRVDTEVDRRLEAIGTDRALALRGKAAVTQAKLAYKLFVEAFQGERWDALAARGARVQRPLWASTGTKNKAYSDVLYVQELIGPDTVNTLTEATIEAFEDHGQLRRTVDADLDDAERVWAELAEVGIDIDDVSARLEREGVDAFTKSFDELIDALQTKADELRNS
jgi:transaldolase